MSFLISSPQKVEQLVDPQAFLQALIAQWPKAVVRQITDPARPHFSHEWKLALTGGSLEGMLNKKRLGIVLDGALRDCAVFAVWFRTVVPVQCPLHFYDENYAQNLELKADTTVEMIMKIFS